MGTVNNNQKASGEPGQLTAISKAAVQDSRVSVMAEDFGIVGTKGTESEYNFIHALLLTDREAFNNVVGWMEPQFFLYPPFGQLYKAARQQYKENPAILRLDLRALRKASKYLEQMDDDEFEEMNDLTIDTLTTREPDELVVEGRNVVFWHHISQLYGNMTKCFYDGVNDDTFKTFEAIHREAVVSLNKEKIPLYDAGDIASEVAREIREGESETFMTTGIAPLDKKITGVLCPSITTLVAMSGQGKTALALQMLMQQAFDDPQSLYIYFSREQSTKELCRRLMQHQTGVKVSDLISGGPADQVETSTGFIDKETAMELVERYEKFRPLPSNLKFCDTGFTSINDIEPKIINSQMETGLPTKGIVIDHWHLLSFEDEVKLGKTVAQESAARQLMDTVKKLGIHCFTLVQARKQATGEKRIVLTGDDIKGSGAVKEVSSQVWILHNPQPEGDQERETFVNIDKSRHMRAGDTIMMKFDGIKGKFGYA